MSQIDLNSPQLATNVKPTGSQTQVAQNARELPQELQNAQPSTSVWSKIGRVSLYIARGIGFAATFGISEGIIWGVKKIYKHFHPSPEAPQPRVPRNQPPMLPQAEPHIDADNTSLTKGLLKLDIPQKHLDALQNLLNDMALRYGNCAPNNLEELRQVKTDTEPFIVLLRRVVSFSSEYVNPGRFQRMAKEILEPEMIRRSIGELLQEKAQELGIQLRPEGIKKATKNFFQGCQDKISNLPMGPVKDTIEPFVNYQAMGNTQNVRDSFHRMEKYVNTEDVLLRASLQDGLDTDNLPPAFQTAMDDIINGLRSAYGQDCLPKDMSKLLLIPLETNLVLDELRETANDTKTAITPQAFADSARKILTPVAQRYAMTQILGEILEKDHGLKLHPKVLPTLLETFEERCPALKTSLANVTNTQTARQAMTDLNADLAPFLADVANNVKAMEDQYLSSVNNDIRPILQNFIRSLPFDNTHKTQSQNMVNRLLLDMPKWKKSIPLGDKGLDAFCSKLTDDLNIRMQTLASEEPSKFQDNLYSTFLADTNRNTWIFNGKVFEKKPQNEVSEGFKQIVSTAIDQQFLSKLTNQYLRTAMDSPLQGVLLPNPNNPQQPEIHHTWQYSGDKVQEEQLNNGLTFRTPTEFDFLIQPSNVNLQMDSHYSITVSEDKKSAVVEEIMPSAIVTNNKSRIPVGTCSQVLRVHCQLSGGDPSVRPRVTSVQISQNINPLNI